MTDWREAGRRREVFLDFYEFHLRYRSHPGGVYYLLPWLRDEMGLDDEGALWLAFLNGNTQHPITSLLLFEAGPSPARARDVVNFWSANYARLEFDTDRRHHKKALPDAVAGYLDLLAGAPQADFWRDAERRGFEHCWASATMIPSFGRLSAFSYLEYNRLLGFGAECSTLFLEDRTGSRSHRNGLCIVGGHDDWDWRDGGTNEAGRYDSEQLDYLEGLASSLLYESKARAVGRPWASDVGYFTLESALCTYKSWHRPNRRYPNVYNDMMYDRIRRSELRWPERHLKTFWRAREAALPDHLRLEINPNDPGLVPAKQNHYRLTGEVIMMATEYPQYVNGFDDLVAAGAFGVRRR